jgi:CHAT domain-containing protein
MNARHGFRLIALLALALTPVAAGSAGPAIDLGADLAGESCSTDRAPSYGAPSAIMCGKNADAGAVIMDVAGEAKESPGADRLAERALAIVDPQSPVRCDRLWSDTTDVLLGCNVLATSWPRIVLASAGKDGIYCAWGLPAALPVLEAAIGRFGGRAPQVPETALKAHFSAGVLASTADDLASFGHLLEAGRLANGVSDYATAESDYRAALDIELRLFGPTSMPVGETLAELALQVSNQARFDEADALFRRASAIIEGSPDQSARDRLTSYLALNAANQNRFADALVFAQNAIAQYRSEIAQATEDSTGGGPPVPVALRGELAHSLRIEAEMALRLGDVATARAAADEAVWIVSEVQALPLWWRPAVLTLSAEVSEKDGQIVAAEQNFRSAAHLDETLFGDTTPTALADMNLGGFYGRQQLYKPAIASYRAALAILEKDPAAGAVLQPGQIAPFLDAAIAAPDSGIDDDVFRAVQLMQWNVADETIVRVAARQAAGDPKLAQLVAQSEAAERGRDGARMALAAEYAKPQDEQDSAKVESLSAALKAAESAADGAEQSVRQNFPAYARLANPGPAHLAEIEKILGPDDAFLTFLISAPESFALSVTRAGLKITRLQANGEGVTSDAIDQDVSQLRGEFVPRVGHVPEFSLKTSYALYQKLLKPVEPALANSKMLIVAPTGALANLPFSLLVTAPPVGEEHTYDKAAWLIRRYAISEVPSARAFLSLRASQGSEIKPADPFLGLGDPELAGARADPDATCGQGESDVASLVQLPPLPDTKREVETVAAELHAGQSDVLLGSHANKGELEKQPLAHFAVLYFATHGLLPGELHCNGEPGLVLSPSGVDRDPVLYASEIASLPLKARLVVLSACNTAAEGGNRYGGGALEGLADSFFEAGAHAVLASHWSVPSAQTTTMMVRMFKSAGQGVPYAEALREAQLDMIGNRATAHPFYWAAFTLIGDSRPS